MGEKVILEGSGFDAANPDADDTHGIWTADSEQGRAIPSCSVEVVVPGAGVHPNAVRGLDGTNSGIW